MFYKCNAYIDFNIFVKNILENKISGTFRMCSLGGIRWHIYLGRLGASWGILGQVLWENFGADHFGAFGAELLWSSWCRSFGDFFGQVLLGHHEADHLGEFLE